MYTSWPLLFALVAWPGELDTRFHQVHPVPKNRDAVEKSPGQKRAVLLIPGLRVHPLSNLEVFNAHLHGWQEPQGLVVQALSKHADVYAFGYAQNVSLENICQLPILHSHVRRLQFLGYTEIILIGHSAGGVLARMFVEDHPDAGVTRVIQVCAPNLGSSWAKADFSVRKDQEPFLHSLTKAERLQCVKKREGRKIPPHVEFLCVVGSAGPLGDGLVSVISQWPDDLQAQGIPAVRLNTTHFTVLRTHKTVDRIAELAVQSHPRWTEEDRLARRKTILGLIALPPRPANLP